MRPRYTTRPLGPRLGPSAFSKARNPDGSYLLTEWNCPQAEVAREYRQLCDRELFVYRELLGAEVFRESRIAGGAARCAYRVLKPKKSRS